MSLLFPSQRALKWSSHNVYARLAQPYDKGEAPLVHRGPSRTALFFLSSNMYSYPRFIRSSRAETLRIEQDQKKTKGEKRARGFVHYMRLSALVFRSRNRENTTHREWVLFFAIYVRNNLAASCTTPLFSSSHPWQFSSRCKHEGNASRRNEVLGWVYALIKSWFLPRPLSK